MKKMRFFIGNVGLLCTFVFSSCNVNPQQEQIDFIHNFYHDLYVSDKKDTVITVNSTPDLRYFLYDEFDAEMRAWAVDEWTGKTEYANWLFYSSGSDFDYVEEIKSVVPIGENWYQVYVSDNSNIGRKCIKYIKIINNNGFKLDAISDKVPQVEIELKDIDKTVYNTFKSFIANFKYYDIEDHFIGGLAKVKSKEKYGYITLTYDELVPCKYDFISDFNDGISIMSLDGKYGCIDRTGEEIVQCKYDKIENFVNSRAKVKLNGKWGYINNFGQEVTDCVYDIIKEYGKNGLAIVGKGTKFGCIDKYGDEIIPCVYDKIIDFQDNIIKVNRNNKWGYVNIYGKEIIPCIHDKIGNISCGLIAVESNGKWGYVNQRGVEVIPFVFDDAMDFWPDLKSAAVTLNGTSGSIDTNGNFSSYSNVGSYRNNTHQRDNKPTPMKICETCNGTGRITIGGGGMALGSQTCPSCGGTGKVFDAFGNMFNR